MQFRKQYDYLGNMYIIPVCYRGIQFEASEIAYVYSKCANKEQAHQIAILGDPYEAKKLGKSVQLIENWNKRKVKIMHEIVYAKFSQNPMIASKLAALEGDIVEENTWGDTFWGVCNGTGDNYLGQILMQVRKTLKTENQVTL
jgi:ribA/ribD-fused uncharacterized protein